MIRAKKNGRLRVEALAALIGYFFAGVIRPCDGNDVTHIAVPVNPYPDLRKSSCHLGCGASVRRGSRGEDSERGVVSPKVQATETIGLSGIERPGGVCPNPAPADKAVP